MRCRGGLFGPAIAGGKIGVSWDPNQQASAEGSIRAKGAFSTHLPLTRDVEERITSLGPVRRTVPICAESLSFSLTA